MTIQYIGLHYAIPDVMHPRPRKSINKCTKLAHQIYLFQHVKY